MKPIKISLISVLLITTVACKQNQNNKNRFSNTPATIPEMIAAKESGTLSIQDTATANKFPQNVTLNSTIDGKEYRLKTNNSEITELYVDNVQVPSENISYYKQITEQMIKEFWTKVALINATGKKINEEIVLSKNSIEQQREHIQAAADSIKNFVQKKVR